MKFNDKGKIVYKSSRYITTKKKKEKKGPTAGGNDAYDCVNR